MNHRFGRRSKLWIACAAVVPILSGVAAVSAYAQAPAGAAAAAGCTQTTQAGPWQNAAFPVQTGSFTVQFDATASAAKMNGVIGLSNGSQTAYTGFAALARFNPSGDIDARNGGSYAASTTIPYLAGTSYHFRMAVDIGTHTYSVFVTAPGGSEQTVGSGFAFRTEQSGVGQLNSWGVYSEVGSETVCGFTLGSTPSPTPTPSGSPTPTPTPTPPGGCTYSGPTPGQPPGCNFDLSHWELQLPTGSTNNTTTIPPSQLEGPNGYQDKYFYTASDGSMTFWDPENGVTLGSKFPRTELREMASDTVPAEWNVTGNNTISATLMSSEIPDHVTVAQIHLDNSSGSSKPLCELFYESSGDIALFLEADPAGTSKTTTTVAHVALGTKWSYSIDLNGSHNIAVTINGATTNFVEPSTFDGYRMYFKAGDYDQSVGSSSAVGALVHFYALSFSHTS